MNLIKEQAKVRLIDYVNLWRVSSRRTQSELHYRDFQQFQAGLIIHYLEHHEIVLDGQLMLDLGSGIGGYSQEFARRGARVVSVDLMQPRGLHLPVGQVRANALVVPLRSESMDIVFCASLIEHVEQPEVLLAEIERLLRLKGMAYVSFPPYYSPMGGHEFAPFHYLGKKWALKLKKKRDVVPWVREMYGGAEEAQSFEELFSGWGLYTMTIRKFVNLVRHSHLKLVDMGTRYMPFSFVRWPLIGELLTWHAQFILEKTE